MNQARRILKVALILIPLYYIKVKYLTFIGGESDISAWPHRGDEEWQLSKDSADAATVR